MLETGTNTELANTSGNRTTKPADWAASALRTVSATKAKIELNARPKALTSAMQPKGLCDAGLEAKADDVADDDHQQDDQDVADQVGAGTADEHRGPCHRHPTKAVDHTQLQVVRQGLRSTR